MCFVLFCFCFSVFFFYVCVFLFVLFVSDSFCLPVIVVFFVLFFVQLIIEEEGRVTQHAVSIIIFLILHAFIGVPTVLGSLRNTSCHFQVRQSLCKTNNSTETDSFWIGTFPVKPKS